MVSKGYVKINVALPPNKAHKPFFPINSYVELSIYPAGKKNL